MKTQRKRRKVSANSVNEEAEDAFFLLDTEDSGDEVLRDLSTACSHRETGAHEFHNESNSTFPVVFRMPKDVLAMPAMSAPSERLFSRVGDNVTQKRDRMLPSTKDVHFSI